MAVHNTSNLSTHGILTFEDKLLLNETKLEIRIDKVLIDFLEKKLAQRYLEAR